MPSKKEGGVLSKKINCNFPHAEIMAIKKAKKNDDLIITDSPCQNCAENIVKKGIRRVVYLKEYYNIKPIQFLKKNGVQIRKAGVDKRA